LAAPQRLGKLVQMFADRVQLPQVIPHDPAKVREQQPWLTEDEHIFAEVQGQAFNEHMRPFRESLDEREAWMGGTETAEQTYDKKARRYRFWTKFIITERLEIVEEPNPIRWSMFLEKAKHRRIEFTTVSEGVPKKRLWTMTPWAEQMRARRKKEIPPPLQAAEVEVSTVFIGTCPGEMFETMIFGGWQDGTRFKNATLIDAKKCHYAAVDLAKKALAYLRKNGRARRKDWIRMSEFWRLAQQRGREWALKHLRTIEKVDRRLSSIPGRPPSPQPHTLLGLATKFLARPTLVENPLMENPE
jgi:hypothetical protein